MEAYERLGLLELRTRAVYIKWRKDGEKSNIERIMIGFHIC